MSFWMACAAERRDAGRDSYQHIIALQLRNVLNRYAAPATQPCFPPGCLRRWCEACGQAIPAGLVPCSPCCSAVRSRRQCGSVSARLLPVPPFPPPAPPPVLCTRELNMVSSWPANSRDRGRSRRFRNLVNAAALEAAEAVAGTRARCAKRSTPEQAPAPRRRPGPARSHCGATLQPV